MFPSCLNDGLASLLAGRWVDLANETLVIVFLITSDLERSHPAAGWADYPQEPSYLGGFSASR